MENENQVIDMKKEIQIRKMKKSDLPQLQEMYRDLIPEGVSMEVLLSYSRQTGVFSCSGSGW